MLGHFRGVRTAGLLQGTLPSGFPGPCLFCLPASTIDLLQAVSETGCRPILQLPISKCKGAGALNSWPKGSPWHFTLDINGLVHAAFLKPVAKRPVPECRRWGRAYRGPQALK